MPKRGENIYKRKDGRWEGRYIAEKKPNGKALYRSVYGKTYREVKDKLQQQYRHSKKCIAAERGMTVKSLMDCWLSANAASLKQSSYQRFRFLIEKHIAPQIGEIKLNCLTAETFNSYREYLLAKGRLDGKGGLSPKTTNDIMGIIRSGMKLLSSEYDTANSILESIKQPSVKLRPVDVLSPNETKSITHEILTNPKIANIAILLSLETGIRLGEVCALKWSDFDLNEGLVHICRTAVRINYGGKTVLTLQTPKSEASERTVPLTARLIMLLCTAKVGKKDNTFILTGDRSMPMEPRTMQYRFTSLLKKLEIRRRGYHVTRHSFATRCIEKGVDSKTLSEILGHSDVKTTLQMYVHPSINMKRYSVELASSIDTDDLTITNPINVKNLVA